jgi:DNA helicase HerA-like ATPase
MSHQPIQGSFHSLDGRRFTGEVSLGDSLLVGDFVVVQVPTTGRLLGQVVEKAAAGGTARVDGVLRASVGPDGTIGPVAPRAFADGAVSAAGLALHAAYQAWCGADMAIGTTRSGSLGSGDEVPVLLRRSAFNRHTFLCGQSGSGKTYALGVLLEQLLAETALRVLVIDPNGDFVGLGHARPDADPQRLARLGIPDVRVLSAGGSQTSGGAAEAGEPDERLAVRFPELSVAARAAALHVDPLTDREEYNGLLRILDSSANRQRIEHFVADLEGTGEGTVGRGIAQRIQNLGILDWDIWARDARSLLEVVDSGPRAVVLDVAGCPVPQERSIAAAALLDHLWERRTGREPVLLVIDEAHNLCPAEPSEPIQALVTARLAQIAAEGRKYGLWLLLSTQQPHKVHPNVLSQCDNLVVMRMGSTSDLARLGEVFGAAPRQMLAAATDFARGEMLLAGGFVAAPVVARVASRLTEEGGSDVRVPLRTPG